MLQEFKAFQIKGGSSFLRKPREAAVETWKQLRVGDAAGLRGRNVLGCDSEIVSALLGSPRRSVRLHSSMYLLFSYVSLEQRGHQRLANLLTSPAK